MTFFTTILQNQQKKRPAMTILNIKFPDQWPGWTIKECNLAGVANSDMERLSRPDCEQDIVSVTVDPKAIADYYSDSPVFRGTLIQRYPTLKTPTVILKFAMREDLIGDLADEAGAYAGPLKPLQGTAIPESFGLYVGTLDDGQYVACLLLECWGDVIRKPFSQLPIQTRYAFLLFTYEGSTINPLPYGFQEYRYSKNWVRFTSKDSCTETLQSETFYRRTGTSDSSTLTKSYLITNATATWTSVQVRRLLIRKNSDARIYGTYVAMKCAFGVSDEIHL